MTHTSTITVATAVVDTAASIVPVAIAPAVAPTLALAIPLTVALAIVPPIAPASAFAIAFAVTPAFTPCPPLLIIVAVWGCHRFCSRGRCMGLNPRGSSGCAATGIAVRMPMLCRSRLSLMRFVIPS